MLIKEVQKFCESKRILIDIKMLLQEYQMKVDLPRNKNDNQHLFGIKYKKYYEMNEEIKARWEKQQNFLQDIQIIAEKKSRPDKAEKDFKRRDKKQNKSQKITKTLSQKIREAELELMFHWFQFNNYLSPIHKHFKLLQTYDANKTLPFKIGLPYQSYINIQGSQQLNITNQNAIDHAIINQNFNLHNLIESSNSEVQYLIGTKNIINLCQTNQNAIEQQFLQLENIRNQLTIPNKYYLTPDNKLKYYEASRVELIGEDIDGELKRIAYSSNLMDHIHKRYFKENNGYIVITSLE